MTDAIEVVEATGALRADQVGAIELAIAGWLDEKGGRSNSRETRLAYTATITQFRAAVMAEGLDLDADPTLLTVLIQAWAGRGQPRPATYNRRLAILSSFYRYAIQKSLFGDTNPVQKVARRAVQAYAGAEALEPAAVKRRLQAIDRSTVVGLRDYVLLAVALQTGRRVSELAGLRWRAVQRRNDGRLKLTWERCKGGKVMHDTLPLALSRTLLGYLQQVYGAKLGNIAPDAGIWLSSSRNQSNGKPLTIQTIADICEKHLGTSKVHATRHTFARTMEDAGAKVSEIQARLGHESLATTGRYLAALQNDDNAQADLLAARLGLDADLG